MSSRAEGKSDGIFSYVLRCICIGIYLNHRDLLLRLPRTLAWVRITGRRV